MLRRPNSNPVIFHCNSRTHTTEKLLYPKHSQALPASYEKPGGRPVFVSFQSRRNTSTGYTWSCVESGNGTVIVVARALPYGTAHVVRWRYGGHGLILLIDKFCLPYGTHTQVVQ